jgi:hypothetical protein
MGRERAYLTHRSSLFKIKNLSSYGSCRCMLLAYAAEFFCLEKL